MSNVAPLPTGLFRLKDGNYIAFYSGIGVGIYDPEGAIIRRPYVKEAFEMIGGIKIDSYEQLKRIFNGNYNYIVSPEEDGRKIREE